MFRSPTCTPADEKAARALAQQLGLDLERYADAMFEAGGDVSGKTAEEVFNADYKIFNSKNIRFGIGQGQLYEREEPQGQPGADRPLSGDRPEKSGSGLYFLHVHRCGALHHRTNDGGDGEPRFWWRRAFQAKVKDGMAILPGVVSRKKQMVPALINAIKLEDLEETD